MPITPALAAAAPNARTRKSMSRRRTPPASVCGRIERHRRRPQLLNDGWRVTKVGEHRAGSGAPQCRGPFAAANPQKAQAESARGSHVPEAIAYEDRPVDATCQLDHRFAHDLAAINGLVRAGEHKTGDIDLGSGKLEHRRSPPSAGGNCQLESGVLPQGAQKGTSTWNLDKLVDLQRRLEALHEQVMKCGELRRERRAPAMTLVEGDGDAGIGPARICLPSRTDAVDSEMVAKSRHVAFGIHRH